MAVENPDIIDAVNLAFGFDQDGFEDILRDNALDADPGSRLKKARVISGFERIFSAYDPSQSCDVIAREFTVTATDNVSTENVDVHGIILHWDGDDVLCGIDLASGGVVERLHDGNKRIVNLNDEPQLRQRILGALSVLADARFGF